MKIVINQNDVLTLFTLHFYTGFIIFVMVWRRPSVVVGFLLMFTMFLSQGVG